MQLYGIESLGGPMAGGPNLMRGVERSLPDVPASGEAASPGSLFANFFESRLEAVNSQHLQADRLAEDFLMGGEVPVHAVMMETAKADTTMRLATSVVQKVIDAYLEVARMQL